MTPYRLPLRLPLAFFAAFCCGALHAQPRGAADAPGFVGLPVTGQLDAGRVLSERHGDGARDKEEPATKAETRARPKAPPIPAGGITGVVIESTASEDQTAVPLSFGQVFAPGDLPRGAGLAGKLADGTPLPLQLDVKASHPDGSVRHAVVSALLPKLGAGKALGLALAKNTKQAAAAGAPKPGVGADTVVAIVVDGARYTASSASLLKAQSPQVWLHGPVVTELQVAGPLVDAKGEEHPHLAARFAIRWYGAAKQARVDVVVENDWAYEPDPRNITYDVTITAGGKRVFEKRGLTHYHHARWRTLAWTGEAPALHLRHDSAYLIASRALPNYDRGVVMHERALAALASSWNGAKTEPMGVGLAAPHMPGPGGRADIGLLPGWAAAYLLSMDARAKLVTLGTADLAGSWPTHYRDKRTGLPVSLLDYPYMTILGRNTDTRNPKTGKQEAFPPCPREQCKSPNNPDTSHQPGFAYLPYLVTGDHYYLEELQFWSMFNVFSSNPGYRRNIQGLLATDQVRGQAWSLRTLGQAAYITPDGHPLKRHFNAILDSNLDWYNTTYSHNPSANKLGAVVDGYAVLYKDRTALAPWQDDFFTAAVGHVAELGFKDAEPLLKWKLRFPVERMVGDGACWLVGANYTYTVRASASAPYFATIGEAYAATVGPERAALPCTGGELASALKQSPGDMGGYAAAVTGFPSNMQPALAYAVDAGGERGRKAWEVFMRRSVKPDYGEGPQFAVVPRK
ncbi:hypothetical protein [Massilia sp. Leaf139]|uniref:hypothetical protein n=1 Tax=Massilia sp. Leaf139 TaxID=1736272 RepID=UPI001E3A8A18|nr:hypothetical protein [Massilia sp. Leaf139]